MNARDLLEKAIDIIANDVSAKGHLARAATGAAIGELGARAYNAFTPDQYDLNPEVVAAGGAALGGGYKFLGGGLRRQGNPANAEANGLIASQFSIPPSRQLMPAKADHITFADGSIENPWDY